MFRPASIFMHGDLSWDQLQIMMSKSSTADLLKMFNKLEEFFSQQFNSSKRAFSGFSQRPPRITTQKSMFTKAFDNNNIFIYNYYILYLHAYFFDAHVL